MHSMKLMKRLLLGAFAGTLTSSALAFEIAPGDYVPMPAGTNFAAAYIVSGQSDQFHLGSVGEIPDSELETTIGIARGVHYFDYANGMRGALQFVLPYGDIGTARVGGADQPVKDGMGDLTLGITAWPMVADPTDPYGTTFGATLFVTLPTGSYDVNKLSFGTGTTTIIPQIGLIQGVGNNFFLEAYADVAFTLDHEESGLDVETDPSYQFQTYLKYQAKPGTNLSIGYSGRFGGEQSVGGTETGLKTRTDQLRLVADTMLSPSLQIQGLLGYDMNTKGGFKQEPIMQLRLVKVF